MITADVYYVARRLRWWLETQIAGPQTADRTPMYQWVVLRDVVESPGSTVQEIAARLGLVQSMVSKALVHWEAQGWLRRETDDRDRRRTRMYPSEPLAQQLTPRLTRPLDAVLDDLFGAVLSSSDRVHLQQAFQILHRRFKALEDQKNN